MPAHQGDTSDTCDQVTTTYSQTTLNQAFNEFLDLHSSDHKILEKYHHILMQDGEIFAKVFYDYLMASPATAKVLNEYQAQGRLIDDLVEKQLQHLFGILSGSIDDASAERMAHIGELHHRFDIKPVWIMGAYRLYLEHLQTLIRNSHEIQNHDRTILEDRVTKLLFRDMGLMLEGYWDAGLSMLLNEKQKVSDLQGQITSLLSNIPQILWSVDIIQNRPLYISPSAQEICSMDIEMPIPCLAWTIQEDRKMVEMAWQNALQGQKVEVESRVNQPDGELRWFRRVFYPYMNKAGEVIRIDGLMDDTTDAKATLERLNTLATTDSLTGLTNRTLFHDRLGQAITAASRDSGHQVVIMLMDLNYFKEINDTLGHPVGDEVLIHVTQRLKGLSQDTDTLARLGGDEFGILLPKVENGHDAGEQMAEKILQAFATPYQCGDHELYLGASIGIAIYPEHGEDMSTLMSRADVAMYGTKKSEPGYMFYDTKLDPNAQQRLQLSSELRHILERNELVLNFQPKIDLRTKAIIGAEALIRWQHPERGLIPPDQFIPLAERTGLIRPITEWVFETAIEQCKVWRDNGYKLSVAVNVSARAYYLGDMIHNTLQKFNMPADCLEIEITENVIMADITHVSAMLKHLSELGVSIAIDDFGTGYSSLAHLKTLPLHTIKIDKSFVLDISKDKNDSVIVRSTIDLAHNLGLNVVAEGIEDDETLDLLTKMGCDEAQGFYFSKPQTAEGFLNWIRNHPCNPALSTH